MKLNPPRFFASFAKLPDLSFWPLSISNLRQSTFHAYHLAILAPFLQMNAIFKMQKKRPNIAKFDDKMNEETKKKKPFSSLPTM